MAGRIALTGGSYKARSLIANAQRCINLYGEKNPQSSQSPVPFTYYPRPGLTRVLQAPVFGVGRCIYTASNGALYYVVGTNVYYVDTNWTPTLLGTIALGKSIVSMADNGTDILMVDGTTAGYTINLATNAFAAIVDPAFYGADRVEYIGSSFILNRTGTPQFYISGVNALTFDPLDFGQKTASPDPVVAAAAMNNQVWLLGTLKGEIWYYSGAADFPFQQLPGVLIDHGCGALYSPAATDKFLFWLTQDKDGKPWIAQGSADYAVVRVSTHALETEIQKYTLWTDAIGYTVQIEGHTFYIINFSQANKTWAYDLSTKEWAERAWTDQNGNLNRDRAQLQTYAYKNNVVVDWQNGDLYSSSPTVFTDNGIDITCVRSFPHSIDSLQRISYRSFVADMQVGAVTSDDDPQVFLRQSVNRGASFQTARGRSMGKTGDFNRILRWTRLSMARDAVFELSWAANAAAALNGAFLDPSDMAET